MEGNGCERVQSSIVRFHTGRDVAPPNQHCIVFALTILFEGCALEDLIEFSSVKRMAYSDLPMCSVVVFRSPELNSMRLDCTECERCESKVIPQHWGMCVMHGIIPTRTVCQGKGAMCSHNNGLQ